MITDRKSLYIILAAAIALTVFFSSCRPPSGGGGLTTVTVSADHTLDNEDVFLIFTNSRPYTTASAVPVLYSEARYQDSAVSSDSPARPSETNQAVIDVRMWGNEAVPASSPARLSTGPGISFAYTMPTEADTGSTTYDFSGIYGLDSGDASVSATCREIVESGGRRLSIYVADAAWHNGGTDAYLVTVEMVTALADRFFNTAAGDDDIWDWSVDIFGEPWGSVPAAHRYASSLIEDGAEDHITILLYDIAGDGSPPPGEGRIVGYFDSFDNYVEGATDSSGNYVSDGRLLFAIDSAVYATGDGTWDTSDYWPQEVFSTLVHEFQHMIHYYRKEISNNLTSYSEVWLNEMCSMVAEDLLAQQLQVDGPRGIPYNDPSAGTRASASSSRLSKYNDWPENSLTDWEYTDPEVYRHYATSYSFGAYIARNYGAAELFAAIVSSPETGYQAVIDAIHAVNPGAPGLPADLNDLLVEWGIATFTSDLEPGDAGYLTGAAYNRGSTWVSSSGTATTFNLGSINLENYDNSNSFVEYGPVPFVYAGSGWSPADMEKPAPASNTFIQVADGASGDLSWSVGVPDGVTVTVLARPDLINH